MKYGLKEEILDLIRTIFSRYPEIEKAILYGSRAKGNYKKGSDIDIAFSGEDLNLTILNKISMDLDDLLLPYSFDLSIYKNLSNKEFLEHIDRVGILIYNR